MDLFQTAPQKKPNYEVIDYSDFKKLYNEFKLDLLYSQFSMNTARIGIAAFNKAIEWGILVPYGSEYCLNEKIKL
jgi:hypothetical protein